MGQSPCALPSFMHPHGPPKPETPNPKTFGAAISELRKVPIDWPSLLSILGEAKAPFFVELGGFWAEGL